MGGLYPSVASRQLPCLRGAVAIRVARTLYPVVWSSAGYFSPKAGEMPFRAEGYELTIWEVSIGQRGMKVGVVPLKKDGSQAHGDALVVEILLQVADGDFAVVENAGSQGCVGFSLSKHFCNVFG